MRVVWLHTDLRMYWPPRLIALDAALRARGDELRIVEIAGRGSSYDFGPTDGPPKNLDWSVLFKDGDLHVLPSRRMAAAVTRCLNAVDPHVVVAGGIAFPSGAAAVRWARKRRRGVVVFDNVRPQEVPRPWYVEAVKRRLYRNVDAMLVPAPSHLRGFKDWGVPPEAIYFGLNAVDYEWYHHQADLARRQHHAIRQEWRLPKRFFLGVGRQIAAKNWMTLVKASCVYRGRNQGSEWGLVLVGDGPERSRLEGQAAARGPACVRFVGAVARTRLCGLYALADCLVLPSVKDTWPNVVGEAMACGLPVLVSNACGSAQTLVHEGRNGWTFSPTDVGRLVVLLERVSGMTDQERRTMGRKSETIISKWSLPRFVAGALGAIDRCRRVHRGYRSPLDRLVMALWNGRYRPV